MLTMDESVEAVEHPRTVAFVLCRRHQTSTRAAILLAQCSLSEWQLPKRIFTHVESLLIEALHGSQDVAGR